MEDDSDFRSVLELQADKQRLEIILDNLDRLCYKDGEISVVKKILSRMFVWAEKEYDRLYVEIEETLGD